MITTRKILSVATINTIKKAIANIVQNNPGINVIIEGFLPLCLGYNKEGFDWAEFAAKLQAAIDLKIPVHIYTYPKDPQSLSMWFEQLHTLQQQDPQGPLATLRDEDIKHVSDLRADSRPEWGAAKVAYEEFATRDDKKAHVDNITAAYIKKFGAEHPDVDPETIPSHVHNEIIDVLSLHQTKASLDPKAKRPTKLTLMFYDHSRPEPMHNAMQNAENMGYFKNSFAKITSRYEDVLEEQMLNQAQIANDNNNNHNNNTGTEMGPLTEGLSPMQESPRVIERIEKNEVNLDPRAVRAELADVLIGQCIEKPEKFPVDIAMDWLLLGIKKTLAEEQQKRARSAPTSLNGSPLTSPVGSPGEEKHHNSPNLAHTKYPRIESLVEDGFSLQPESSQQQPPTPPPLPSTALMRQRFALATQEVLPASSEPMRKEEAIYERIPSQPAIASSPRSSVRNAGTLFSPANRAKTSKSAEQQSENADRCEHVVSVSC